MSISSIFDISLSDQMNLKLADRLSLISINIPSDIADKQAKLKDLGLSSSNTDGIERNVTILTNYLLQKSFLSTIRSLIKAVQLAERLRQNGREAQRNALLEITQEFLTDMYAFRSVSPEGEVIADTSEEVIGLFSKICEKIFTINEENAESKILDFISDCQKDYIRIVLERTRRLASTIESVGNAAAMNEKIESMINKMETANLEWLIDTYTISIDNESNRERLPEIDNKTQHGRNILLQYTVYIFIGIDFNFSFPMRHILKFSRPVNLKHFPLRYFDKIL